MLWGVTTIRLRKDNSGQMSIDFLVGISIFLLAFLYLIANIPTLFVPFQSNSDELTMAADKVAATLVESELANTTDAGMPLPGIIDYSKFDALNAKIAGDSEDTRKKLGLGTGSRPYNLEIVLQEYSDSSDATNITISDGNKAGNSNVGQSRRFVTVRYNNRTGIDNFPGIKAVLVVRVW